MSGMPGIGPVVEGSYPAAEDDGIMVVTDIQNDRFKVGCFTVIRQRIAVRNGKLVKEGPVRQERIGTEFKEAGLG
jgi:hypothetical protein